MEPLSYEFSFLSISEEWLRPSLGAVPMSRMGKCPTVSLENAMKSMGIHPLIVDCRKCWI